MSSGRISNQLSALACLVVVTDAVDVVAVDVSAMACSKRVNAEQRW